MRLTREIVYQLFKSTCRLSQHSTRWRERACIRPLLLICGRQILWRRAAHTSPVRAKGRGYLRFARPPAAAMPPRREASRSPRRQRDGHAPHGLSVATAPTFDAAHHYRGRVLHPFSCPVYSAPYPDGHRLGFTFRAGGATGDLLEFHTSPDSEYVSARTHLGWVNVWTLRNRAGRPVGIWFVSVSRLRGAWGDHRRRSVACSATASGRLLD